MRRILLFLITVAFLFLPKSAFADEGWVIDRFSSNIQIEKTGVVAVEEKIDVDFNALEKHGIFRDIPYVYDLNGTKTYTDVKVLGVTQNNRKAEYKVTRDNGYIKIRIGDPDETITGRNSYVISYEATGVLRGFENFDELYWNVTGNNWPVAINKAESTVQLPENSIIQIVCFEGYTGSTTECDSTVDMESVARFSSTEPLGAYEGLTVVTDYKKGIVPLITVERPKTFWEKLVEWPSLTTLILTLLLGTWTTVYMWYKHGRDYWYGNGLFGDKNDSGTIKPIGAHETTVVEFTPPEKLRPAELGVLMDEKADTLDVVATIIDLAARGYLTITEIAKKWIFGKKDYILNKKQKSNKELLVYESMLLNELFKSSTEVKMSSLKTSFYDELKKVKDELYKSVVDKGLFPTNPEKVRSKYLLIAFLLIFFGGFFIAYTISFEQIILADLCLGMIISGIILLVMSPHMPRRTAYGRGLYRRIKGYRLFIGTSEKYRQRFFEKKNLFNEVLPYAIVFGLTDKFSKAMEEMGVKPTQGWYTGTHPYNMHTLSASMNDFSGSMSQAMASTPSSSGSSGGSSGGGFSGGGGGSW